MKNKGSVILLYERRLAEYELENKKLEKEIERLEEIIQQEATEEERLVIVEKMIREDLSLLEKIVKRNNDRFKLSFISPISFFDAETKQEIKIQMDNILEGVIK